MTNEPRLEELTLEEMRDIRGGGYYFALPVFLSVQRLIELLT